MSALKSAIASPANGTPAGAVHELRGGSLLRRNTITPWQPDNLVLGGRVLSLSHPRLGNWPDVHRLDPQADFRLFAGFRWATLDQDRHIHTTTHNGGGYPDIVGDVWEQDVLSAYGIGVGGESRWRLGQSGFSLFARGEVFGLVGFEATPSYQASIGIPVIETAAGLSWKRGHWEFSGGYEISIWPGVWGQVSTYAGSNLTSDNLILDGFFARVAFSR